MAYQMLLGRFYLASNDFTVNDSGGADTLSTTAGYYYPSGYSGDTQLCEHLQSVIRANGGVYTSATVTLSAATGLITIDFATGGTDITLNWTDTDLRNILGFTENQSGAKSDTATNQMRYVWRPTRSMSDHPVDLTEFWSPATNTKLVRSTDGTTYAIRGNEYNEATAEWQYLPQADVITNSSTAYESLQEFYSDVIVKGQSVRLLPDRTSYTSSSYKEALIGLPDKSLGSFRDFCNRHITSYNGLWSVSLPLAEYA